MTRQEEQRIREVLFKEQRTVKCNFFNLSEDTGIPERTLRRWKRCPDSMPFSKALIIAKANGLTPEEAGFLMTGARCK